MKERRQNYLGVTEKLGGKEARKARRRRIR
jgi:hypothetical protein